MVPRIAHVLTSVRSSHSALCTSTRFNPSTRAPIDSSAADTTCACTPSKRSTALIKLRRPNLDPNNCCSNLHACSCSHLNESIDCYSPARLATRYNPRNSTQDVREKIQEARWHGVSTSG